MLGERTRRDLAPAARKATAVLVPLIWRADVPQLLFTKRSLEVSTHKGQISFPGGRREPGDASLAETALRECEEEIGLPRERVRLLGALDDITTQHDVVITPYLAEIPDGWAYTTDPHEVAAIFDVPVAAFLAPGMPRVEMFPGRDGHPREVFFYDLPAAMIWGATARIVHEWLVLAHLI